MPLDKEKLASDVEAEAKVLISRGEAGLKKVWTLTGIIPYFHLGLLIVVIILVIYMTQCGTSKNEKQLDNLNNQGIEKTVTANSAEKKSEAADANSRRADKAVVEPDRVAKEKTAIAKAARNANTTNTNYSEANKQRCLTYPESTDCK